MPTRIVGNDGVRNTVLREFERGQQRALIAGPRLIDPNMKRQPGVMRQIHRRGCGAVVSGRQPPRVAMRQDVERAPRIFGVVLCVKRAEQCQSMLANGARQADIFFDDGIGAGKGRLGARSGRQRTHRMVDLVECPAQVYRRRARRVEHRVGIGQRCVRRIGGKRQRQSIGPDVPDKRRAPRPHFLNRLRGRAGIA